MRARPLSRAVLVCCATAVMGCPAVATRQTAETVPSGDWQVGAGLDGVVFRDVEQDTRIPSVMVDLGVRHGVAKDVDVGARLYSFGFEAGGKWVVVRGSWRVALAPSVDLVRTKETDVTTDALHVFGHMPLILGHDLSSRVSVNLGPRMTYGYYFPSTGGDAHGWFVGGFGNVAWKMSERWSLLPEVGVHRSVAGEVPIRGWVMNLGTGVLWDL